MSNSRLYETEISHIRTKPKLNRFSYRFYHFLLDLDEIENIGSISRLMAYEKLALLIFLEKDHLKSDLRNSKLNIKERVKKYLKENRVRFVPDKIFLLTHLRIFNYVFNPVSFYYCYDTEQNLRFAIAEVNNTFSEQKTYLIDFQNSRSRIQTKNFYVSPFIHHTCNFEFKLNKPDNKVFLRVNSRNEKTNKILLASSLKGSSLELNTKNLIKLNLKYPLVTFKVIFLIHWQALKLLVKKIDYFKKKA